MNVAMVQHESEWIKKLKKTQQLQKHIMQEINKPREGLEEKI